MEHFYHWQNDDLLLSVKLQPGASKNEIVGIIGEALKIRISAPPVDGRANKQLIAFLADVFKVAKSDIQLLSGHSSRNKRLLIQKPRSLPAQIRRPPAGTDSRTQKP